MNTGRAIEALTWIKDKLIISAEYKKALDMAIEALQDDWIPLNDDSVAPYYEVMCQDRHGNMMFGYASVDKYGIWMCEDDGTIMDDVIAWRPLPKPYEGGDE